MKFLLTASANKGLFCNGLNQNIYTLCELLQSMGHEPIIALGHSIKDCVSPPTNILMLEPHEIQKYGPYDYILQTGWVLSKDAIDKIKSSNPDCKNIHVHYGNRLLADVEQSSWDKTKCIPAYKVDEVLISPHYSFSKEYFQVYYKTDKINEIPYIWSPSYIIEGEKEKNKKDETCFYQPNQEKKISILEPNLNITKHSLPSIFICEDAFTKSPENFPDVSVYCASKLMNATYMKTLMWNLEIQKQRKIFFAHRARVWDIFSKASNIIVSHQLLNALNYTYLEALYFNLPLIHNSEFIKNCGYFYPDYEVKQGGAQLSKALKSHDSNLEEYKIQAQKTIFKYSIKNPDVIKSYKTIFE